MRLIRRSIFLLPLFLFLACGKAEESAFAVTQISEEAIETVTPIPVPEKPRRGKPAPQPVAPPAVHGAAHWAHLRRTEGWSTAVISAVRARMGQLEQARDVEEFCPGYFRASQNQREACWLRIVSAMSKFESSFNPRDTYREATGQLSIGLLSLSRGECPEARSESALKDPEDNLRCGVRIMARLIDRDHTITGPEPRRGASDYWSVLRKQYKRGKRKSGRHHQITAMTRDYLNFSPY